jgi:hypothetical protein
MRAKFNVTEHFMANASPKKREEGTKRFGDMLENLDWLIEATRDEVVPLPFKLMIMGDVLFGLDCEGIDPAAKKVLVRLGQELGIVVALIALIQDSKDKETRAALATCEAEGSA